MLQSRLSAKTPNVNANMPVHNCHALPTLNLQINVLTSPSACVVWVSLCVMWPRALSAAHGCFSQN